MVKGVVHHSSLIKSSLNKSFRDIKKVRNYHGKPAIFLGCILPLWVLHRYYKNEKPTEAIWEVCSTGDNHRDNQ